MQNPFLRLKHYRSDPAYNDPRENHATEALAACLVFSDSLRADLLNFFLGRIDFTAASAKAFEVFTQHPTDNGKWIDLFLEQPGGIRLAVEVKVQAREDGRQIKEYRSWLARKSGEHAVVSLVRDKDPAFRIEDYGGHARRTWKRLFDHLLQQRGRYSGQAEERLIDNLCDYLEAEQIVSTWTPKQILNFGNGMRANHALETLFEQVSTSLRDSDQSLSTNVVMKRGEWPRLEIGKSAWTKVYGTNTYLNKLCLYYETSAAWGGDREGFFLEVLLWNKWQGGDWPSAAITLPDRVRHLKEIGFTTKARLRGNHWIYGEEVANHQFVDQPLTVSAWSEEDAFSRVSETEISSATDTSLVNLLLERVRAHLEIVEALPSRK